MLEAEQEMKNYLSKKTLAWLHGEVYQNILSPQAVNDTNQWFDDRLK